MRRSREIERQLPAKKRKKIEFVYGNYPSYYGYRIGRTLEEDPRVGFIRREWIENRDCLDIGCNQGHVTIALAVRFCCKSMVGVDIDPKLIHKARQNLKWECEAWSDRQSSDAVVGNAGEEIRKKGSGTAKKENGVDEKKDQRLDRNKTNVEKNGDILVEENDDNKDKDYVERDLGKQELRVPNGDILAEENEENKDKDCVERDMSKPEVRVPNGDILAEENEENKDKDCVERDMSKQEVSVPDQSADRDFIDAEKKGAKLPDESEETIECMERDCGIVGNAPDEIALEKQGIATNGESVKTYEESMIGEFESGTGSQENTKEGVLSAVELSQRVTFKTQNYIESRTTPGTYDTILCLSVSKWIHLNWGDDGLLKFFAKIFKELRPGGCMVLEPQPWESYNKKRKVSETTKKNFYKIHLRPDSFPSLLTEKIGFKSFEQISAEVPSDKTGFRRPLFAYYK